METPYTVGESIPLKFHAEWMGEQITPESASVSVFSEEGNIVNEDPAEINDEGEIEYIVDSNLTKHTGDYVAHFTLHFPNQMMVKNHPINFSVLPREIPTETINTLVAALTGNSTDEEIEEAIASTIRKLRKQGFELRFAVKQTYDTAQKKLGRRLGK